MYPCDYGCPTEGSFSQIMHNGLGLISYMIWLKDTLLLTKNIIPHNLVVKKQDDGLQLKIIDGLGCASFIPLPEMNRLFARQYVNRRIELMHARIRWDLSGRQGEWK